jgi:outer membrane protein assembly factor BamD
MNEFSSIRPSTFATFGRFGSVTLRAAALVALVAVAGCSLTKDDDAADEPDVPAGQMYNQGLTLMQNGKLKSAAKEFEKVDQQHPYTEWARKALIMTAFTNYRLGNYEETVTAARRYISLYPSSSDAGYAQYMIGQSYFKQIPEVTRDQDATKKAIAAMQEVVDKYPNSEYVDDAQKAIVVARDQIAGKEMEIGRYNLERKRNTPAPSTASRRCRDRVRQTTRHVEEALMRLTEAYMAIGVVGEAQTAAAVLGHNFPDSKWYKDAYNLVKSGGLEPSENKGSYLSKAFKRFGLG